MGNSADYGGAADFSALNNCTIIGNSALIAGGGTYGGILNNCIVYNNDARSGSNFPADGFSGLEMNYCCTAPLPTNGIGNFTNAPRFLAEVGNFHLAFNSPCINAGRNGYAPAAVDLDGSPRIVGGTVDIGAYEFQSPQSTISYAWLQQHGLPFDGSADSIDTDGDGANNWQEWRAGTEPTNSSSLLRLHAPEVTAFGTLLHWQSVSNRNYSLERSTNVATPGIFTVIASNIVGETFSTSFTDTNAVGPTNFFYRVRVND